METPSWLNKLLLFGTILMATTPYWTNIKPAWGIASAVAAGLIGAFGDGIKSFVLPAGVTIAGLFLVAGSVVLYIVSPDNSGIFAFISPKTMSVLMQAGPILTIIGEKLKGASELPTRTMGTLLLIGALVAAPFSLAACDWGKASRPLTAVGYNVQTALLAAGRTVKEIAGCKAIPVDAKQLSAIKRTSQIVEQWSKKIDETVEINPQTKVELITLTDGVIAEIGKTFALLKPGDVQFQERLLVVRALVASAKITIAALDVTKPVAPREVNVKTDEAAKQAVKAGAKNAEQNICIIDKMGAIASQFAGDVLVQKGLDAAALKNLRGQQFDSVQAL